ncbi:MAG: nitroreductase family protein [Christensenellales bacterium]
MEAYEAILTRRSIRKYTDEPVSSELCEKIIKAGMYAPSAHNSQPWHFIAVTERETLDKLSEHGKYYTMLLEAQLCVIVCAEMALVEGNNPVRFSQDCAAATQNILLAAHDAGLGGVWLGVYPSESQMSGVSSVVELPSDGSIVPVSMISLGWPAQQRRQPDRFKPERIHYGKWRA